GSLENRARFACEIIDGIKARCGEGFEVLVRLTVDEMMETIGIDDGIHLDEGVEFAKIFEAHGVAAIDVTCGNYETMNVSWEPVSYDQGWKDHLGKAVKAAVKIPVIAVSVMREPEYAVKMINSGVCDIAGSARQFFCDPDWGNKALRGRASEIRKCISCLNCMETLIASNDTDQPSTCSLNIEAGEEFNLNIDALEKGWGRKVAVIGAGPAGMECARVLALRGFGVTLFEKSDSLGGQIKLACKPPKKDRLHWIIDYFKPTLERLNVEIRLNTAPTADELVAEGFENVFYAAGSSPVMPGSIPGIHGKNILTPPQILSGEVKLSGENICVIGSGMTGIETAELLAMNGNKITLWEMADDIGPGLFFQNLSDVLTRLVPTGCEMHPGNQLIKLEENEAFFKNVKTGEETSCKFDHAIVSLGVRPVPCPDELKAAFPKLVAIGDAEKGGRIRHATETGYFAAYNY
ncbi:MAG: FAD-dependent oxidoreductase, partial [Oscillospiraceae bacterium]|nr:FAD-dependent oxidoreductase [Oscillospiraceae bacterium]